MTLTRAQVSEIVSKVEEHLLIIARYDEVLCEKASKHSVVEICAKLEARYNDIDGIAQ